MKKLVPLFSVLALIILCTYSGCGLLSPSPKETLPPATQTGANTFGCYVNGKLWVPKGYNGTSNLDLSYDPTFKGGTFNLSTYRIVSDNKQDILIGAYSLASVGNYNFNAKGSPIALFYDRKTLCSYDNPQDYLKGSLIITKLDISLGIASGTFEFTLAKSGCDTVKVTQGRFDMKM
jgi:hypothetical protein